MNNNNFSNNGFGNNNLLVDNNSFNSNNKALYETGLATQTVGGIAGLYGNYLYRQALARKSGLINQQSNLQLSQIQAQKNIADIQSMVRARQLFGNQLAQAGTSGASLASPTLFADTQSTFITDLNRRFMNDMNATTNNVNVLFQKQNQLQQVREAEDANVANTFGNIVQGAITAAELAALLA